MLSSLIIIIGHKSTYLKNQPINHTLDNRKLKTYFYYVACVSHNDNCVMYYVPLIVIFIYLLIKYNFYYIKSYFLAYCIRFENGFSHVYILIICIPEIISSINLTLSSVLWAVLIRNSEAFFPSQPKNIELYFLSLILNVLKIYDHCNNGF